MQVVVASSRTPVATLIGQGIKEILSSKLQVEPDQIPETAALGDLGFDSLGLSDLAEAVEEKFDVQVPNRIFPSTLTVEQLIALVIRKSQTSAQEDVIAEPAD